MVIWSDETLLQIGHSSRQSWVICQKGEELDPKNVHSIFKNHRAILMVWACFTGDRIGPLMIFDKLEVSNDEYMEVILDGLVFFLDDLL